MINLRIIYPQQNGIVTILTPALNSDLTIEELARKDVPAGIPYKIINVEDIPTDRTFRNAWEADFSSPDGYGIGHAAWFAEREGNV
jgi:hypothetical protein